MLFECKDRGQETLDELDGNTRNGPQREGCDERGNITQIVLEERQKEAPRDLEIREEEKRNRTEKRDLRVSSHPAPPIQVTRGGRRHTTTAGSGSRDQGL